MRQQQTGRAALESGDFIERRTRDADEILTSEEARRLLKIGRTKLWDLTKRSMIPAYRVGEGRTSGLRYKRSELLRWLDNNRI
jgi:excisionase family DNA binding protein